MKLRSLQLLIMVGIMLAACGAAAPQVAESPSVGADAFAPEAGFAPAGGEGFADVDSANTVERLVIKNASLSIVVNDTEATIDAVTEMVEGMGGFVVTLNTYQTAYGANLTPATQASMTVRVPSEQLDAAMNQIESLAVEVRTRNISGQDVTSEYTDLQSRLRNLEAAERQLQSIMEEATKTEDVLAVYNQLVATRSEIEVIKGQIKYYEEAAAMSAISLDIIPNAAAQPIEIGGWHPEGVAKESIETLVRITQGLIDFLIRFTIVCGPFLLVIGVPLFVIGRWLVRRARQNVAKVEAEERGQK